MFLFFLSFKWAKVFDGGGRESFKPKENNKTVINGKKQTVI